MQKILEIILLGVKLVLLLGNSSVNSYVNFADIQCGLQTPRSRPNNHWRKAKVSGEHVESTYAGEFPFLVSFGLNNNGKHFCGGFIISRKFIISAAHCFSDFTTKVPPFPYRWMEIVLGENVLSQANTNTNSEKKEQGAGSPPSGLSGSIATVATLRIHPEFNETDFRNDIALIELEEEIEWSPYKQPICLPGPQKDMDNLNMNSYSSSHIAGWGSQHENKMETSKILKKAVISPIYFNSEDCQKAYNHLLIKVHETHMCAGGLVLNSTTENSSQSQSSSQGQQPQSQQPQVSSSTTEDSCYGDSGGPLMVRDDKVMIAIGIVSSSHGCSRGYPSLYSKISVHIPWIQSHVSMAEEKDNVQKASLFSFSPLELHENSIVVNAASL